MKKTVFLKKNKYAFAAFFMPVLILVLAFAVAGIYPFGIKQIAIIDMYHQYVPFLGELRRKLLEGGSLFYSWNGGGGYNFWCLISYYAASPLNLLLLLFPQELLMEGVTVLLTIKIGLAGSFMYIYLKNVQDPFKSRVDRKSGWQTVVFSCMYALSAYVIAYYWCIMWLEAVMLLPLCMLGLDRLIKEGRFALYTVSLALIVLCNYYIAFMVCIFIFVYYPVMYFTAVDKPNAKVCAAVTVKAVLCSCLAIAMAAVMLLPTVISMKSAYYFSSEAPDTVRFYNDMLSVLNQLLPNAQLTYLEGLPNLCCGLLVTFMLILYFRCGRIFLKEKALHAVFLAFMLLSLNMNKLDFIWHGLHFPNQLPFRFSFVICFVITGMAYRTFRSIDSINLKDITTLSLGLAVYYLFAQKLFGETLDDKDVFFYYGIAFLTAYSMIIVLYKKGVISGKSFSLLIAAVAATEMFISASAGFDTAGSTFRDEYSNDRAGIMKLSDYVNETAGAVSESGNGEFARVEIDRPLVCNSPAFYHYRGMSMFSSTLNANTAGLMEKIGLDAQPKSNRSNYNETDPVTNCITNVNYLISKNRKIDDPDFEFVKREELSSLYRSRYPLSLGYELSPEIRTWSVEDEDPFANLDDYVRAASGGAVRKVFIRKGQAKITDTNTCSEYETGETIDCSLLDGEETGRVSLEYTADESGKYYVYISAEAAKTITIEREQGYKDLSIEPTHSSIRNIGSLEKGESFSIRIDFKDGKAGKITCRVCTLDYDAWNRAYEIISANPMKVTDASDTFIKGTIGMKEDGVLVTSIPFDEGWTMKVDGIEREIGELAGGAWITADLSEGQHEIELNFCPPGIKAGALISVLSILVFISAAAVQATRRRRPYSS